MPKAEWKQTRPPPRQFRPRNSEGEARVPRFDWKPLQHKGRCMCGKQPVWLNLVAFSEPVSIKTWNGKERTGTRFVLGSECLKTFNVNGGVNPFTLREERAAARRAAYIRSLREMFPTDEARAHPHREP